MLQRLRNTIATLRQEIVALGAVGPIAVLLVAMPFAGIAVLVAVADPLTEWLDTRGETGVLTFAGAGAVLTALSMVPTHAISLIAGYVWGLASGSGIALAVIAGAAVLGHRILARLAGPRVQVFLSARPRASTVRNALLDAGDRRTFTIVMLVRLSPLIPFAGTNLLMAATGAGLRPYTLGSIVGLAPRVVALAVVGAGLAQFEMSSSSQPELLWGGVAATLIALVVITRIAGRALRQATASATS